MLLKGALCPRALEGLCRSSQHLQPCSRLRAAAAMVQMRRQSARTHAAVVSSRGGGGRQAGEQQAAAAGCVQDQLEGIRNFRDLAEAFPAIRPGMVFRTAAPLQATAHDVQVLYSQLGIKDLIDLRSSEEIRDDGHSAVFEGASFCRYKQDSAVNRVVPDATTYQHGDGDIMRVQVPVMEKHRYYFSLLSRMKKRQALHILALSLLDKPASRRLAIQEVNKGGLQGLYTIFLEDCAPWFVAALRHIVKSLEADRPVLFFCKAGKDRTGLLAALILDLLGADEDAIVADYSKSDEYHMVGLAGIEDNPKATGLDRAIFERAPREALHHALALIEAAGGAAAYLEAAGLSRQEQEQLRQLLSK